MNNNDIFWITRLRALATIAVIVLHISAPILISFNPENITNVWWIGNFYNSTTRFCVPIFLMISGALLIPQQLTIKEFYRKRLKRVLLPFMFWSLIYLCFTLKSHYSSFSEILSIVAFKYILSLLFAGNESSFHLWYIFMIIPIYLITPVISKWARSSKNNELLIFIAFWLVSLLLELPIIKKLNIKLDLRYFSKYLGYIILGYYIFRLKKSKNIFYLGIGLTLIGFLITLMGTYYLTLKNGQFVHFLYEYLSLNVILSSAGIFIIIKSNLIPQIIPRNLISILANYSFGIYLSHILILNFLTQLGLNWKTFNPIISVPIVAFLCIFSSVTLIWLLRKIPYIKQFVG